MSSILSEAYKDDPLHLRHIIPIDFTSLNRVPDSHNWPPQYEHHHHHGDHDQISSQIPLIDLNGSDAPELISHACETWGVFQLKNHGIPINLLNELEFEAHRFFDLPATTKLKALRSPGGITGYGIARISKFFDKFMWHEGFTIMGSPIDHAVEIWPSDYQRFCDVMVDYQRKIKPLAEKLTRLILINSLNISDEQMIPSWNIGSGDSESVSGPCTALQLNSYPSCPDPNRAMGLAPHTDTSMLTILHQSPSKINGLQVFKDHVGWVPVCPPPGALVVNIGDLFHILSNGRFPTVVHRVVANETQQRRLSAAYFYGPPADFCVSPVNCNKVRINPCYRCVTVKEYVSLKAKNLEKALDLLRI